MRKLVLCALLSLAVAGAAAAGDRGTPEEARVMLDRAVKLIETEGEANALTIFNDPEASFHDRDLYVFCFGQDGKITAHPKLVGTDVATIEDADGRKTGKKMVALGAEGGGKLEYKWENPVTGKVEPKVSFIKKAGTQVCGVGAYGAAK